MHLFKKNGVKLLALAALAMTASLYACGDEDDKLTPDEPDAPIAPADPSGSMDVMSPTQSKLFLEDVAKETLNLFKPADQKELIDLCAYFDKHYADLEFPENFEPESRSYNPSDFLSNLSRAVKTGDASLASRAAATYTYNLKFADYAGIYEPKGDSWVKIGNSSDIIFRFTDASGKKAEVAAKASTSTSDVTITFTDWDYDWSIDDYEEIEYICNIYLPHEVTVTVKVADKTLATAKATTSIDEKGHKMSAAFSAVAANLECVGEVNGNDTQVTEVYTAKVGNVLLSNSTGKVTGTRLCDRNAWENVNKGVDVANIVTGATATVNLLDKLQVYSEVKVDKDLCRVLDSYLYYDSWDYNTKSAALNACEKDCSVLNQKINAYFCYNNTKTKQGKIVFQPNFYEYDYYYGEDWEYYVDGVMEFESDGSTYSFEDYFGRGFDSVGSMFESLVDNYVRVWENARK